MFSIVSSPVKKAVAYYRHSAEDKQENSIPIQREHAERFAKEHQLEIIHEEADEGKTGLLATRPGFERLFKDWVLNPAAAFDYILVYDVSRWGRFQDQDESAHYEFLCKQHGKRVVYVSKGFPKDEEQLIAHLQTSIDRYMAADYSRQLSDKVFHGCVKVSQQGYSAGGTSCYGMTRILLDAEKKPVRTLKRGEWKALSNERVTFAPAGDGTTEVVKEIFTLLVEKWQTPKEIAETLNDKGTPSPGGKKWDTEKVVKILSNETYTGTRVYNRTWGRLRQKTHPNPRSEWVLRANAFPAVVDGDIFSEAQEHLYWLLNSRWKRGIYATNRASKLVYRELENLIRSRGISEDDLWFTLRRMPLVFGVKFYNDSVPHWCFLIEEATRNYASVVGVGVAAGEREPMDRFFFMPTSDFNSMNFNIFSEADGCYAKYQIKADEVERKIFSLLSL
jgi:DNA invertase Pin-like site-specific DNA recombinase